MKMLRIVITASLASLCALAAVASAQETTPSPSGAPSVDMIEYCADRRVRRMTLFYPPTAFQENIRGEVRLDCAFTADETLHSCQVIEETPAQHGFGAAALAMACHRARKPSEAAGSTVQVYTPEGGDMVHMRWTTRFRIAGDR